MISNLHNFIFVHVPKVGGTSMRKALRPHADGVSDWQRAINKASRRIAGVNVFQQFMQPLDGHATAKEYLAYLGDDFHRYFSFGFVRNPFDWHVSLFEYVRQTKKHPQHELFLGMEFGKFIEWKCRESPFLQKKFLFDDDGRRLVNFIGRFESLNQDFEQVLKKIGVNAKLPHRNGTRRAAAFGYYTEESARLLVDACIEDFDEFGYDKSL